MAQTPQPELSIMDKFKVLTGANPADVILTKVLNRLDNGKGLDVKAEELARAAVYSGANINAILDLVLGQNPTKASWLLDQGAQFSVWGVRALTQAKIHWNEEHQGYEYHPWAWDGVLSRMIEKYPNNPGWLASHSDLFPKRCISYFTLGRDKVLRQYEQLCSVSAQEYLESVGLWEGSVDLVDLCFGRTPKGERILGKWQMLAIDRAIQNGVDPNGKKDIFGPLMVALEIKDWEMAHLLAEKGARLDPGQAHHLLARHGRVMLDYPNSEIFDRTPMLGFIAQYTVGVCGPDMEIELQDTSSFSVQVRRRVPVSVFVPLDKTGTFG